MGKYLKLSVLLTLLFIAGFIPGSVSAWTNTNCLNNTHQSLYQNINIGDEFIKINTTKLCPYGCINETGACSEPYSITPVQAQFGLPLFLIVFIGGLGSLWFGATRKHIILTMFATIMFFIMALQSVALDSIFVGTFFSGMTSIFVMVSWLLAIVSLAATLIGMVYYASDSAKKKKLEEEERI